MDPEEICSRIGKKYGSGSEHCSYRTGIVFKLISVHFQDVDPGDENPAKRILWAAQHNQGQRTEHRLIIAV